MAIDHLAKLKLFYEQQVFPHIGAPIGCSEDEIDGLERVVGHPLPLAYRQYLRWMGRDHRGIFVGCDWFLNDVRANTEYLPGLLAENHVQWNLPDHYLAFMGHQGYITAYFALPSESDDPIVYLYSEGREPDTVTAEGTFTDFLFRDLSGMAACLNRHP
ncbi:SMI1/KNR4 family protein [Rubripirellula tenax]|nr:SMI1/KNR4 family protein [Rubripirellula tenax]